MANPDKTSRVYCKYTCCGYVGSLDHDKQDAHVCKLGCQLFYGESCYKEMSNALNGTSRPIFLLSVLAIEVAQLQTLGEMSLKFLIKLIVKMTDCPRQSFSCSELITVLLLFRN
ncbi:hypothetical protein POMI540_4468 [Schizosaccharomyces pombe]